MAKRMTKRWPAAVTFIAIVLVCALVVAAAPATGRTLFLLAGTATNESAEGYPVTLYTIGPARNLVPFREITSSEEGLYEVREGPEHKLLYVSYPPGSPTTVSVVHEDTPSAADEVKFNPKRHFMLDSSGGLASGSGSQSYALYLLVAPGATRESAQLVSVAGAPTGGQPRVERNKWQLYKSFRFDGCPGGPAFCVTPKLKLVGGALFMGAKPNQVEVEAAPPALSKVKGPQMFQVVASSSRFLVISRWYDARALASKAAQASSVYVRVRESGSWKKVEIPGNRSRSRLFGAWLATIVEDWNPANRVMGDVLYPAGDNNPGRDSERMQATPALPSVRMGYESFEGNDNIIPGVLARDDLVDGRRITLRTGQEDSEVLDVRKDGLVLYRVNDEIFSAQIEGDKLSAPALVVKGEDVPEVHWAFWSDAPATRAPSAKPSAKQ